MLPSTTSSSSSMKASGKASVGSSVMARSARLVLTTMWMGSPATSPKVWDTPVGPVTVRLPVRTSRSTTVFRNTVMPGPLRSLMTVREDMWSGRAVF